MKFRSLIILLLVLISLVPAFFVNRLIRNQIQPRKSFFRFLIYLLLALVLVFIYTFFWVWIILYLFPVSKK